jgi:hypothetical protein
MAKQCSPITVPSTSSFSVSWKRQGHCEDISFADERTLSSSKPLVSPNTRRPLHVEMSEATPEFDKVGRGFIQRGHAIRFVLALSVLDALLSSLSWFFHWHWARSSPGYCDCHARTTYTSTSSELAPSRFLALPFRNIAVLSTIMMHPLKSKFCARDQSPH